jgi:hypothetical protein
MMGQCGGAFGGGKWKVDTHDVDKVYKGQGIGTVSWNSAAMAEEELQDPANLDFRPVSSGVASTLCIGAYKYVGKGGEYWIPGHQEAIATAPIPPHKSITVKTTAHLMFKPARGAVKHFVYAAASWSDLKATIKKPKGKRIAVLKAPKNIVVPKKWMMPAKRTNFWRVDAVYKGNVIKVGKIWKFTVAEPVAQASSCVSFSTKGPLDLPDGGAWSEFELKIPLNGGRPAWEHIKNAQICLKASHEASLSSLEFRFVNKGKNVVLAKKEGSSKHVEGCFADTGSAPSFPQGQGPWKAASTGTVLGVLDEITSKEQLVKLRIKDHDGDGKGGTLESWSIKICYDPVKQQKVPAGTKGMCSTHVRF